MKSRPTYEQSLADMIRSEPTTPILNPFWQRANWPKGNKDMIFLGDVLQKVGKLKFREDWNGTETAAQRRVSTLSTFAGTLEFYWERVRDTFPAGTYQASSQADWEGTIPPPLAIPTPTSSTDLKRLQRDRARRLERENADLKPTYQKFAEKMTKRKLANDLAKTRLEWVIAWIADHGRLGDLKTTLRLVRTNNIAGTYISAPEGIWNTEDVIRHRFHKGFINFDLGHGELNEYYIFISTNSLEKSIVDLNPYKTPYHLNNIHLSPYMKAIIEAIEDLNINPDNQYKVSMLAAYLQEKWKGPDPLPAKMAARMATVMRETNSQNGAHKHISKA